MKKITLLILPLLFITSTYGQCEDMFFLKQLLTDSKEKQEQLLDSKGFKLNLAVETLKMVDYVNAKNDNYIAIYRNNDNKVIEVLYRLKSSYECYNKLMSELSLLGFNKEIEMTIKKNLGTIKSSTLRLYYRSENYGVKLSKWNLKGSEEFYSFAILDLANYHKQTSGL